MSCGICRWQKFLLLQVYYFQGRTTKAMEWSGGAQLQTKSLNKNDMFGKNKDKLINCLLWDCDYYDKSYLENQMAGSIPYHEHCPLCVNFSSPTWGFVFKPWPHEKKRSLSKAADGMDGWIDLQSISCKTYMRFKLGNWSFGRGQTCHLLLLLDLFLMICLFVS